MARTKQSARKCSKNMSSLPLSLPIASYGPLDWKLQKLIGPFLSDVAKKHHEFHRLGQRMNPRQRMKAYKDIVRALETCGYHATEEEEDDEEYDEEYEEEEPREDVSYNSMRATTALEIYTKKTMVDTSQLANVCTAPLTFHNLEFPCAMVVYHAHKFCFTREGFCKNKAHMDHIFARFATYDLKRAVLEGRQHIPFFDKAVWDAARWRIMKSILLCYDDVDALCTQEKNCQIICCRSFVACHLLHNRDTEITCGIHNIKVWIVFNQVHCNHFF